MPALDFGKHRSGHYQGSFELNNATSFYCRYEEVPFGIDDNHFTFNSMGTGFFGLSHCAKPAPVELPRARKQRF
jgi:hypothetical protein